MVPTPVRHLLPIVPLVFACGCGPAEEESAVEPVLVVGIDGLEPTVVADLIAAGRLPNLASIAERGVIGRLESMVPTYSPVIWTTIATGQLPSAHGIEFFHDEAGRPFTSNARRVPALWNVVSDLGRTVNCVGWWNTWPAEPIRGRMLSSYAAQAQANLIWKPGVWEDLEEQTWPPDLQRTIRDDMVFASDARAVRERLWQTFPRPRDPDPTTPRLDLDPINEKSVTDLGWSHTADLSSTSVASRFLREWPADLTLVYLAMTDVAGHRFWNYHEPEAYSYELEQPARSDFADYVNLSYVEADRMLGELLAAAPEDATVIVLSDHGMHAYEEALDDPENGSSGHHPAGPPGIFAAMGPRVRPQGNLLDDERRGRLGHVLEVAPLVLRLLELPVPEHWPALAGPMDLEQVLDEAFRREHPRLTSPDRDGEFRAATDSRLPMADVDEEFLDFMLNDLGYGGVEARREARERSEDDQDDEEG